MAGMAMRHDKDPRQALLDAVGNLQDVELFHNQVLVAVYVRGDTTRGGIILPDQTRDEDEHQGKVGLIVKKGPNAFEDPDGKWAWGDEMDLNDWIFFRAADGWGIKINGVMCRILSDVSVRGRVQSPDQVW